MTDQIPIMESILLKYGPLAAGAIVVIGYLWFEIKKLNHKHLESIKKSNDQYVDLLKKNNEMAHELGTLSGKHEGILKTSEKVMQTISETMIKIANKDQRSHD